MKRYGNLFDKIIDKDNLRLAHTNARRGKVHYKEVKRVDANVEKYIDTLHWLLVTDNYEVAEYDTFDKVDKGKLRKLYKLPYFPDRVVQHAIMQAVEPIWKTTLIHDTHQAIKGRGVFTCLDSARKAVHKLDKVYCLQMDVRKFYPSVDNIRMKTVVRKKIKCSKTLNLLDNIIDSCEGLPIGNYISQYLGNLYMSEVDRYIKEHLKVKHYFRYCDDLLILDNSSIELHRLRELITAELRRVGLQVKGNYQVYEFNNDRGIDFLGAVITPTGMRVRKSIANSFKELCRQTDTRNAKAIVSYFGWFKYTRSFGVWDKYVYMYVDNLLNKYGTKVLQEKHIRDLRRLTRCKQEK